jgi:hypothetical protein
MQAADSSAGCCGTLQASSAPLGIADRARIARAYRRALQHLFRHRHPAGGVKRTRCGQPEGGYVQLLKDFDILP